MNLTSLHPWICAEFLLNTSLPPLAIAHTSHLGITEPQIAPCFTWPCNTCMRLSHFFETCIEIVWRITPVWWPQNVSCPATRTTDIYPCLHAPQFANQTSTLTQVPLHALLATEPVQHAVARAPRLAHLVQTTCSSAGPVAVRGPPYFLVNCCHCGYNKYIGNLFSCELVEEVVGLYSLPSGLFTISVCHSPCTVSLVVLLTP